MKYRLWVACIGSLDVFYEEFDSREEAEKRMDKYLQSENYYVISLEEVVNS
ncbi:hypothetical protein [Thermococcus sp. MV5]|uniref:hypothetical protein n=1 Tax=Thermococcus sp. MV5 TaxID=1638272 RepID=UPI001438ABFC|nr:hypothetical protein [Thermococcus sp. MV5]